MAFFDVFLFFLVLVVLEIPGRKVITRQPRRCCVPDGSPERSRHRPGRKPESLDAAGGWSFGELWAPQWVHDLEENHENS